jgi:hypothetical protein
VIAAVYRVTRVTLVLSGTYGGSLRFVNRPVELRSVGGRVASSIVTIAAPAR